MGEAEEGHSSEEEEEEKLEGSGAAGASVSCLGASGVLLLVPMGMMLHHALGHAPPGNMYSGVKLSCVPRHAS